VLAIVNRPAGGDIVAIVEVDEPRPEAEEALVQVSAVSVNRGELSLLANRGDGWRPGQDLAGVVVEPALDGSGPPRGSRVVGLVDSGGWAERVAVPTRRLSVLPPNLAEEIACALPIAGLTALRTVRLVGSLLGRRVLVTGASGTLGGLHVELAKRAGAEVVAVARRDEARLLGAGASAVVPRPGDVGLGFDAVFDSVGGATLSAALAVTRPGALVVILGSSSGAKTPIDVYDFIGHETVRLINYMSYASSPECGNDLHYLATLAAAGELHPLTGTPASWADAANQIQAYRDRRGVAKPILRVGHEPH
jgi:NADPH2:quinone reductase